MAFSCRKIYYKYLKWIVISVLIAFFMQIYIAINLFPSENDISLNILSQDASSRNSAQNDDENIVSNAKRHNLYLRVEELDFKPICEVNSREAISAIHRAKSQKCKQEIVNKTCLIQDGMFYPKALRSYCLSKDKKYGTYLGCFLDEKKRRLLTSLYGNYANSNSPGACLNICLQAGLPYAGVQYATECFCGDSPPDATSMTDESACNMKCSGDPSSTCGGYFTMNIFETGLDAFAPVSPSTVKGDKSVKIVFLLTLNGRALRQVYRLINAIYRSSHYIYIHVDSRQDYMFRKLLELEKRFPNIKLATKRYSTIWGGASLLKMLLSSMREFFQLGWTWDFVINLSESDFPIKSIDVLEEFLSANKDLNFVKSQGKDIQRFIKKQGLDKTFIECDTHMWRVGDRQLPRGVVVDGGSDWLALSHSFVKYVVEDQNDLLNGLNVVFEHTLLPAESYFHTVLRNSGFCKTYVDNNLHVTNWKRKLGCKCQYKHVVDWCGCSPNDFRIEDWGRIQMTQDRQLFFARKFEPIVNQEIITKVEQLIGFKDHDHIENLNAYWQSIYDADDLTALTDDLLLTHAGSLARRAARLLAERHCLIQPLEILEINSYSVFDTFKGNLVLQKALSQTNEEVVIETWYKLENTLAMNDKSKYFDTIKMFHVSTGYDQKELMFRNLANVLGPLTTPTLMYQFSPSVALGDHLTVIWLDPGGVIADVNSIHVNENNLTNFIVPQIKTPMLPGIWKVGLFQDTEIIAVSSFLITPLESLLGTEMSELEANIVHSGSQNSYKVFADLETNIFIPSQEDREKLQKMSSSNSKRLGKDLKEWIDSLNAIFYTVLGTCISSSKADLNYNFVCGRHKFDHCEKTEWSSLSPDPKGTIGVLNKATGRLDRS